jgi:hypothetical protein
MNVSSRRRELAERLARNRYGTLWDTYLSPNAKELEITRQVFFIANAENAGLILVEAEDGR